MDNAYKYRPKIFRNLSEQRSKMSEDSESAIRSIGSFRNKHHPREHESQFDEKENSFGLNKSFNVNQSVANNLDFQMNDFPNDGSHHFNRDLSYINLNEVSF